ncbi:MAG: hypothetical protein KIT09_05335 [Bryobacteraceae bacterium]|nr:hypothetical protein [Bryobacteraceae bacterium]
MKKVALIHWNQAEAEMRGALLRAAGFEVDVKVKIGPGELRAFRENPPDAFVIDLDRMPSHGKAVGVSLRQYKATRAVPLVFVGGEPDKAAAVRLLMPDAAYADWSGAAGAAAAAMADPPAAPVVPGTMQGYSGTPLVKKLAIKAGSAVALMGAPESFEELLGELPAGARLSREGKGPARIVLLFAKSIAELERRFPRAAAAMAGDGGLWIVWPKKTSPLAKDLSEQVVRAYGLERGWVDYKICAVDATWSGLLFARRRAGSRTEKVRK